MLFNPVLNKGTAFTEEERDKYKLHGFVPPRVSDPDVQLHRALENMRRKYYDIEIAVAEKAYGQDVARLPKPANLKLAIENYMYDPRY